MWVLLGTQNLSFYILIYIDMSQLHALLSITLLNNVYVYECFVRIKKNQFRTVTLGVSSPILTVTPPSPPFPVLLFADCDCARD